METSANSDTPSEMPPNETTPVSSGLPRNHYQAPVLSQEIIQGLSSTDPKQQLLALTDLKSLVAKNADDENLDYIPEHVARRLVQLLGVSIDPKSQLESAWILTKITAGATPLTNHIIEEGLVMLLVTHLGNDDFEALRVQSVWILGNIAGDGPQRRDLVLLSGVLPPLLHFISQATRFKRTEQVTAVLHLRPVRLCVWCLANLCRSRPGPPPNFASLLPCLPVLARLLHVQDKEVLRDACYAFANLSDGTHDKIQSVINTGVTSRLIELLRHSSKMVVGSGLRAVGNILLGDDNQTQVVIDNNGLPALMELLLNDNDYMRKDACRAISNVTAGNSDQIQAVMNAGIFPVLIALIKTDNNSEVALEAGWAVLNVAKRGTQIQMGVLTGMGCDPRLFDTSSRTPSTSSTAYWDGWLISVSGNHLGWHEAALANAAATIGGNETEAEIEDNQLNDAVAVMLPPADADEIPVEERESDSESLNSDVDLD